MKFAKTCARAVGIAIGLAGAANAQPVFFTGDVEADFGPDAIVLADPNGIDVGMPLQYPLGSISGNDIKDVRFSYDAAADTMYVGFNTYRIAADVDSELGPDVTGPVLGGLGGTDFPLIGDTESITLIIDVDEDGVPDVTIGVGSTTDIAGFAATEFAGSVFVPGFAYGAPLAQHTGATSGAPSAASPDFEFTIPNWSALPTSGGPDPSPGFAINGFIGSFADAGIGEDFTPGAGQFAPVCVASPERCDGLDNDCDGDVDEGFDVGSACSAGVGSCETNGVRICDPTGESVCSATPGDPQPEACNSDDDDCDGRVDEGTGGGVCTSDLPGVCADGEVVCRDGRLDCEPSAQPTPETCNGTDEDCDGRTDEGYDLGSACAVGVGECRVGGVVICDGSGDARCSGTPSDPNPETCDGGDNDCDGQSDEGFGVGDVCTVGVGACGASGVRVCDGNGDATCSATPGDPQAETCNGEDDDCDGRVDEGTGDNPCATGQPGVCSTGNTICVNGAEQCEPSLTPSPERCDGVDSDCDGETDEGFGVGEACAEGVGQCRTNGVQICGNDGGVRCSATPGDPRPEACNGDDDDCDGRTDEGTGGGACTTADPGQCSAGEVVCAGGQPVCEPVNQPVAEACNNQDDDCDGSTDEGLGVGEACVRGVGACRVGGVQICAPDGSLRCSATPGDPEAETCNGIDDDCDGRTDEGFGLGDACAEGVGACRKGGEIACDGTGGASCNAEPGSPAAERCDSDDNDCDGTVDEGFGVGDVCQEGVGACASSGIVACTIDGGAACDAQPGQPEAEVCDANDNDCDGSIDEGLGLGEPCADGQGACAANGVNVCDGTGGVTCSATEGDPQPETCNDADDDCDGSIDEGFAVGEACREGEGQCAANGVNVCDGNGGLRCSATPGDPAPETCNSRDDDCDGQTDEGFGVGEECTDGEGACQATGVRICDANGDVACTATGGTPMNETCNGADDDCDGRVDESTGGEACETGNPGACGHGVTVCEGGAERCVGTGQPGEEICNEADDDCDGVVDEGFAVGEACNEGEGECAAGGVNVCDPEGGIRCSATPGDPAPEACNSRDDDCDGETDEGFGVGEECAEGVGACFARGILICDANGDVACTATGGTPMAETCNGIDDDCDGRTDEGTGGDACDSGAAGACGPGTTVCEGGALRCEPGAAPGAEACNGADDDCDGTIDEGFGVGEACNQGQGECAAGGVTVCDGDGGTRCSATPGDPQPEACNSRDDDCDGQTDEGFDVGEECTEGVGACFARGILICDANGDVACTATGGTPMDETCNGIDDDCDGETDEGTGGGACDTGAAGACGPGTNVCEGGALRCVPGVEPGAETCDGTDEDCDGRIDEDFPVGEACSEGVGACAVNGVNVCDPNGGVRCSATPADPQDETCNGADDDCDGSTDEGQGGDPCQTGQPGACGAGTTVCDGGRISCEPNGSPDAETCNAADDDCDGRIDEDFDVGEECRVGQGVCANTGEIVCTPNGDAVCNAFEGYPGLEDCDGLDNDCDGETDEGTGGGACQTGQPGACGPGTQVCVDGALSCDPNAAPGDETCNDADDDCDGETDEGFDVGDACTEGVGACGDDGRIVCDGDGGATCDADPGQPEAETCDGTDEDCDGSTDEGLGLGEPCREGVGACAADGERVCDGNGGVTCNAEPGQPGAETCNGMDDDCDGRIDEGTGGGACNTGRPGACGPGTEVCVDGALSCDPNGAPGAETCDGTDEDCDGSVDEGYDLGERCREGQGACGADGEIVCDDNGGATCDAEPGQPAAETCNATDDDCDGRTDEGFDVGDECSVGQGVCANTGEIVCTANGEATCSAHEGYPGLEDCDGLDNDCDGTTDEGTGGGACNTGRPGACGPGTEVCVDGALSCDPNGDPGAETCDGADEDCDGSIDEGYDLGERCSEGVGACGADGEIVCDGNGGATCNAEPGQPGAETCNGVDDDCDGRIDEGTGGGACNTGRPGACGPGTEVCVDGALSCDPNGEPGAETCDGTDEDCDGSVDEGYDLGERCREGVGACGADGEIVCDGNGGATCNAEPGQPNAETCNAADDDCDGRTDEGFDVGDECSVGQGVCANTGEIVCGANGDAVCNANEGYPALEDCDGLDNDCDGQTDEGTGGGACNTGRPGACGPGTEVCVDGALSCDPSGEPGAETCDGTDEDCDGSVDEGYDLGERCREGQGACGADGEIVCDGNGGATCNAEPGEPNAETCNAADDDCDGRTDEGFDVGDECSVGQGVCANTGEIVCGANGDAVCNANEGYPALEDCDGLDNDCDGETDEGTGGGACDTGRPGACGPGTEVCVDGALSCDPSGQPGDETCNDADDDCDGRTDEGFGVGERCSEGEGACAADGVTVCGDDGGVTCSATPADPDPRGEVCDALDNDCDGSTDEGLGLGERCSEGQGACAADGETICDGNGGTTCSAEPGAPQDEVCDGLDNDCDGNVDEGLGLGERCTEGHGACAADGVTICDGNGGTTCDAEPVQPGDEVCDDMDNDCDGHVDEGFGVGDRCTRGQGLCRDVGERVCDANGGVICDAEPGAPSDELCDEEDNDCDGLIDEDFDLDGDCEVGIGECRRDGQRICGEDDVVAGLGGSLVINGSFEQPRIAQAWQVLQEIEGWTTISGMGIEIQRINDAAEGEQYVELDSHPTPGGGCMMQIIPVDVGGIYRLGISHSPRPNVADNRVAIYWDGVEVAELDGDGRGLGNTRWSRHEFDVTGNGAQGTLVICDVTNDRDTLGGFVDDVTLEMVEGILCDAEPGEPEDERCDALDNDCDGYVDEDLGIGDECEVGVGACAARGAFQCDEDGNVFCAGRPGEPVDEACDDIDNDCDGEIDEGDVCDEPEPCSECEGKVTRLILRYDGDAPATITVEQRRDADGPIFDAEVAPGETFELVGQDRRGTLSTEIHVSVDGREVERIHTSCSVPIGPGQVFGDFTVVQAWSRIGGLICGEPPADPEVCDDEDNDGDGRVDEGLDCGPLPPQQCPQQVILDFQTDANGNAIEAGADLSDAYSAWGVHLRTTDRNGRNETFGIAFDTGNPTGGDPDLGTPNRDFGGPGQGDGGRRGREGENAEHLGNVLIRPENTIDDDNDGLVDTPDDHAAGARFSYTFDGTACIYGADILDIEERGGARFKFYDANGDLIGSVSTGGLGNNSYERVDFDVCGVARLDVKLVGSGAIDNIEFCIEDPVVEPPLCVPGEEFGVDEYSANGHAFWFPRFEGNNRTVRMHLRDDARFVVDGDGAHLTGTAFRTDNGDEYAVDVRFSYRGQGAEHGGPKIEQPAWQPEAVTDLWHYFDMTEGTLTRGDERVSLTQMPADGRYPLQVGMAANGKNQGLGMSSWYTWIRENPRCRYEGHGDINVNLEDLCE